MNLQERFDAQYEIVEPEGCWVWTGSLDRHGYGRIRSEGPQLQAHRASWELHKGPVPKGEGYHGICVLHRCDNPPCVNPIHLFLGSHTINMVDKVEKGRSPRGETHGKTKLTDLQVVEIRALAGTMLQREIGARFGVSQTHVGRLISQQRRPHGLPSQARLTVGATCGKQPPPRTWVITNL